MCLGIPAQVVELIDAELQLAKVDVSGVRRTVNVALLDGETAVGDWVLLHVGFALARIDEEEALETRSLLERLGEPYELELGELRASRI
ncbi:MAG: HypC/HybG/HupF family hydrogenase formation chaperone [Solirubrobacteraceae bacterium]|jgi:hydrogenase expression/formation protein HypC